MQLPQRMWWPRRLAVYTSPNLRSIADGDDGGDGGDDDVDADAGANGRVHGRVHTSALCSNLLRYLHTQCIWRSFRIQRLEIQ